MDAKKWLEIAKIHFANIKLAIQEETTKPHPSLEIHNLKMEMYKEELQFISYAADAITEQLKRNIPIIPLTPKQQGFAKQYKNN